MSEAQSNNPENNQFLSDSDTIPEINPIDPNALKAKKDALKAAKRGTSFFTRALIMILILLLVSGLIGGFYYILEFHKRIQYQIAQLQSLTLKQGDQWKTSLYAYQSKIEKDNKNLENQIENQALQLQQLSDKHNWRLSEVIYLVSIAQERLNMGQEETTAIKMLKTADDRLKNFSDVRVGSIRESIIKNIASLETSLQFDKMGVWLELGALRQQLPSLSFHSLQANIEGQPEVIETTQENHGIVKSAWRQALEDTWKELKGLIRIREFNVDKLNSSLEPKDQIALLRAMDLILIEAQWGVLQENPQIYKQSLDLLEDRLNVYFIHDELWKNMVAQINTLKAKNIQRVKVDLSDTLSMLNNLEKASLRYHGDLP